MRSIGLVHIVWKPFGLEPFRRFLESYRQHPAGLGHQLIVLFKGFGQASDLVAFHALLAEVDHLALDVADRGFDVGSYLEAVQVTRHEYYCFVNSRSAILAPDWLAKLHAHASGSGVGIVGATASCESLYSDYMKIHRFASSDATWLRALVRRSFINRLRHRWYYPAFPNFHIRTNAFMVRREILGKVRTWPMRSRIDTSRFENGRRSITRQILGMRLAALVVGRDGNAFEPERCRDSETFWHGEQANLLVADNQTGRYASASPAEQENLTRLAWGPA